MASRVRAVFDELDTDKNGTLDQKEFRSGLKRLKIPGGKKIESLLRQLDADNDGLITFSEFEAFVESREQELRETFDQIDVNNDGSLGAQEVKSAVANLGLHISDDDVRALFKNIDTNQDNSISFDEFRDFLLLIPEVNVRAVFEHWLKSSALDIGEDFTVPDDNVPNPVKTLAAGGIAGAVSRTMTAPMDRLKVLLQAGTGKSSGIVQGLRDIYMEGGLRAFYRGNGTNILKIAPESGMKFFAYDFLKRKVSANNEVLTLPQKLVAGGLAGMVAQTTIYPLEITKTRLAIAPVGTYTGIGNCIRQIVAADGVRGLYGGLTPSLVGVFPYAGVDLAVYNTLKDWYAAKHQNEELPIGVVLGCGAFSSTCGQVVAYPLQLIRTKLQAQGVGGQPVYNGMGDCARQVLANEGILGFYRGIVPNFMKALPAVAISYAVFEEVKKAW